MLKTRFTAPFLIIMAIFIAYDLYVSLTLSQIASQFAVIEVFSFFIFLMNMLVFFGTFGGSKSDRDFLFALPLPKRDLVASMYVTRFLSIGIIFIFVMGYLVPGIQGTIVNKITVIVNIAMGSLLLTAIATIGTQLSGAKKAVLSAIFTVWAILGIPYIGFQFSYLSALNGSYLYGTMVMVAVNIPVNYYALKGVYEVELGISKSGYGSSAEMKGKGTDFGTTPSRSIMKYYFMNINISGRTNMGGNVTVTSRGFKLRNGIIATAIMSIAYFIITVRTPISSSGPFNMAVFLATGYLGVFAPLLLSTGVISFERAWLSFVALPPGYYMRNLLLSKQLQVFVLLLPFTIASIVLQLYGIIGAVNSAIVSGVMAPASTSIFLFLSTKATVVQIKDTEMMPARYSLRQMFQVMPALLLFVLAYISAVIFWVAIGSSILVIGVSAYLTMHSGSWEKSVNRLTERGFV